MTPSRPSAHAAFQLVPRRWLSQGFWRRKLVFILGAALIGVISAGFANSADLMQVWFEHLRLAAPILVIPCTALAFDRPPLSPAAEQRHRSVAALAALSLAGLV